MLVRMHGDFVQRISIRMKLVAPPPAQRSTARRFRRPRGFSSRTAQRRLPSPLLRRLGRCHACGLRERIRRRPQDSSRRCRCSASAAFRAAIFLLLLSSQWPMLWLRPGRLARQRRSTSQAFDPTRRQFSWPISRGLRLTLKNRASSPSSLRISSSDCSGRERFGC